MTNEELAAIEARAGAATAGPWVKGTYGYEIVAADGRLVVDSGYDEGGVFAEPDADFIAASRLDIPALCAEVRRLNKIIQEYADDAGDMVREILELKGKR